MERMERRWSCFTSADIQTIADATPVEKYTSTWLSGGEYMPPFAEKMTGKKIKLCLEHGRSYTYRFLDTHTLQWKRDGEEWREEYCDVLKAPGNDEIYLVQHYCRGSVPPRAHTLVVDLDKGLCTICIARVGNAASAREVQSEFLFGILDGYEDTGERHGYTEDLVGTSILWTYHEKEKAKVKHIYTAPLYYTYVMTSEENKCWVASNPADYIRINDHMYVFVFREERQAGVQGFFLINLTLLHDVGSFFGIQAHGMECCTFGAKGDLASPYAVELCRGNR